LFHDPSYSRHDSELQSNLPPIDLRLYASVEFGCAMQSSDNRK
jgi:hypothetical protein